jgi:hypothetical protein
MPKPQLNLYVDEEMLERLDQAVERFGKKSRATAALEIIETYFDFWIRSEEAKYAVIEAQKEMLGKDFMSTSGGTLKRKTR